jgi:hypothetical protein
MPDDDVSHYKQSGEFSKIDRSRFVTQGQAIAVEAQLFVTAFRKKEAAVVAGSPIFTSVPYGLIL